MGWNKKARARKARNDQNDTYVVKRKLWTWETQEYYTERAEASDSTILLATVGEARRNII